MKRNKNTIIVSVEEGLKQRKRVLPKSWIDAAGILKNKNINPIKYQRQIRSEWERRLKNF